ncbi:hypothetical protein LXL04_034888 [Taraxacum kok-saghyz]
MDFNTHIFPGCTISFKIAPPTPIGIWNENSSSIISAKHRLCIWWDCITMDCWGLLIFQDLQSMLELKNIKQEDAKFWKQHPALVKAHLTPELQHDFKHVVELAPRLLQELMKATVLDPADYTGLEAALDNHKVSLYFTESPTNPFLRCVDIELVSKMCHEKGAIVCIDGTFATPLNQKALALGWC